MSSAADRARWLAHKAESDFVIARLGFEHKQALDMVCFHLQQGIPALKQFRTWLPDYIPYAVHVRYDEVLYPDAEETQSALTQAEEFRGTAHALLDSEGVSL